MEIKKEKSFGVIPIFKDGKNLFFCIVQHSEGHWGFPKGHQDQGESDEETARREVKEETGISDIEFLDNKFFTEQYSFMKDGFKHDKSVKYFIGLVPYMTSTTPDNFKKEIPESKWFNYQEAMQMITFPEAKRILEEAYNFSLKARSHKLVS